MSIPRVLLAAGSSGSGKTLIVCGLLQVLKNRGLEVASFKCGPDYIDPMFHGRVIGTKSANLDSFLSSKDCVRYLLRENAKNCQIAVLEGVMGYYDGLGGLSTRASAYEVADTTDTPVILIVNTKGASLSSLAMTRGFMDFRENSHIAGVIFNQMSPKSYPEMKKAAESLEIQVFGYVPTMKDCVMESRHLGLLLPEEIPELQGKILCLAERLEETLEVDKILQLANSAEKLEVSEDFLKEDANFSFQLPERVKIGVAKDEAFCFFYKDNFRLLEQMGAELLYFSPLHDKSLPEGLDGLLLYGGYPELHAKALSGNTSMLSAIRGALESGMPCMAECGGFMYLHRKMEDMNGTVWPMVGFIDGEAYRTTHLQRFGYVTLEEKDSSEYGRIPAHEYHYFDSTNCGEDFVARKAVGDVSWQCMHNAGQLLAGFPHLYYYGNPRVPLQFLKWCAAFKNRQTEGKIWGNPS